MLTAHSSRFSANTWKGLSLKSTSALRITVLFTVVIMVISGRDSWLYDAYVRCDTNWYFICGRALMNGLTPYVDFVDSKGPLLWLIYGVGYLLTPHSFIGVFWLECLVLLATLWIGYKMAILGHSVLCYAWSRCGWLEYR